ncbi:lipocalin family protein [uncultured Bacteroides sp.]|uniref:lipocalin family protein n=1 Tax=uncultured Bacteroides sp. TaxID=162156 RepID=UPI00261429C2|nr:lipocalin family protein [uncultured Bacteroides sp.]
MKKLIFSMAVLATIFAACGGKTNAPVTVVGSWIMPIEGQPGEMQSIKLEENGEASSINMHTLIYKEWEQQGDYLYLTVKSIGNGIEIEGVDTLKIDKLTADSLVLISNYGYTLEYVKQK